MLRTLIQFLKKSFYLLPICVTSDHRSRSYFQLITINLIRAFMYFTETFNCELLFWKIPHKLRYKKPKSCVIDSARRKHILAE